MKGEEQFYMMRHSSKAFKNSSNQYIISSNVLFFLRSSCLSLIDGLKESRFVIVVVYG